MTDNIKQYVDTSNYELSGLGYWGSANSWSAMALKDKITGTQANRGIVSDALGVSLSRLPCCKVLIDSYEEQHLLAPSLLQV